MIRTYRSARNAVVASAASILLSVLVAGCAEGEPSVGEQPDTVPSPTAKSDKETTAPSRDCRQVSMTLLKAIASGGDDANLKAISGAAVKSNDYSDVYMIAMEFSGIGSTEQGVWASNSLEPGGGLIMAVDGMATEFTVWPNGPADSPMSITDHGAQEALDCLE